MQPWSSSSGTIVLFPDRNFRAPTQYNRASPDEDTSSLVKTLRKYSKHREPTLTLAQGKMLAEDFIVSEHLK